MSFKDYEEGDYGRFILTNKIVQQSREKNDFITNSETQTSKTSLQLAALKLQDKPWHEDVHFKRKSEICLTLQDIRNDERKTKSLENPLAKLFSSKYENVVNEKMKKSTKIIKAKEAKFVSSNDEHHLVCSADNEPDEKCISVPHLSRFTIKEIRVKSVEANQNKFVISEPSTPRVNETEILEPDYDLPSERSSVRRRRSLSISTHLNYIEDCTEKSSTAIISIPECSDSSRSRDAFHLMLSQIKSSNWDVALKALVEFVEESRTLPEDRLVAHMTEINQRVIEFLRSPRSYVCRKSCQIAGQLFETVKDTRRPEFDEIVELLLMRTADSNKFIRKDANLALDSMVMNISPFHAIRAICQKGPDHKNDLIRITSARLFVCIVGIAGTNLFLNHPGNEFTRKRIYMQMVKFIKDKNFKTREFGVRLYKMMRDHGNFEYYLKKIVDKCSILEIGKILKEKS